MAPNITSSLVDEFLSSEGCFAAAEESLQKIQDQLPSASNEATIAAAIDIELILLIEKATGIRPVFTKEESVNLNRSIKRGRTDSRFGALVVEYKIPGELATSTPLEAATGQLGDYLIAIEENERHTPIGFLTDGERARFLWCRGGEIQRGGTHPFSETDLIQLMRAYVSLERVGLSAKNLVRDFCEPPRSSLSASLFDALYDGLRNHRTERTQMLFSEWQRLFRLAHNDKSGSSRSALGSPPCYTPASLNLDS